jgi:hypothetical protein
MKGFTGVSVSGLTDKHARVGDDKEGPPTEFINQGGTEHCGKQIEDLNGAQPENWSTSNSRMYSVVFIACIKGFAHLKAAVDGTLSVGVFHPDFLKDQMNVIRHQTVSTTEQAQLASVSLSLTHPPSRTGG